MGTTREFEVSEDSLQHAAAIKDGLALLTSGDLDYPDRDSAWH